MLVSVLLPTSSLLSERKPRSWVELSAWIVRLSVCRSPRTITNPITGMEVYTSLYLGHHRIMKKYQGIACCATLQVLEIFENWESVDFARAGSKATQDFSLAMGPLESPEGPLSHTVEPFLRQHKLPVKYALLPIPHPPPPPPNTQTPTSILFPLHSYTLALPGFISKSASDPQTLLD